MKMLRWTAIAIVTLAAVLHVPTVAMAQPPTELMLAVDLQNEIIVFNSTDPCTILNRVPITNLPGGEKIRGIDFRQGGTPSSPVYALGTASRLYLVPPSGVATQIGTGQFSPLLSGTSFGFDFNPVADRIRVVSNTGQNLRLNPDTGAVAAVDTPLSFGPGPNQGQTPRVIGAAYTNPDIDPNTGTTLYDVDFGIDSFVIQNPPNDGILVGASPLGVKVIDPVGFDISLTGLAYVLLPQVRPELGNLACDNNAIQEFALLTYANIGSNSTLIDAQAVRSRRQLFGLAVVPELGDDLAPETEGASTWANP
ncbi:MAG: DUF4394 domain-containing protein [Candidatus Binatia bacterium]